MNRTLVLSLQNYKIPRFIIALFPPSYVIVIVIGEAPLY